MTKQVLENDVIEFGFEIPVKKINEKKVLKPTIGNKKLVIDYNQISKNRYRFRTISKNEFYELIMLTTYEGDVQDEKIVNINIPRLASYELDSEQGKIYFNQLKQAGIQNG